jgi:hypothetical protein
MTVVFSASEVFEVRIGRCNYDLPGLGRRLSTPVSKVRALPRWTGCMAHVSFHRASENLSAGVRRSCQSPVNTHKIHPVHSENSIMVGVWCRSSNLLATLVNLVGIGSFKSRFGPPDQPVRRQRVRRFARVGRSLVLRTSRDRQREDRDESFPGHWPNLAYWLNLA